MVETLWLEVTMMWRKEHFVVSYSVALFFVVAAYSLTWITGTHKSRSDRGPVGKIQFSEK